MVGRRFRPHEHVRVTVTVSGVRRTQGVRAGAAGRFTLVFLRLGAARCDLLRAVAVRQSGVRIVLKRLPAAGCLPS